MLCSLCTKRKQHAMLTHSQQASSTISSSSLVCPPLPPPHYAYAQPPRRPDPASPYSRYSTPIQAPPYYPPATGTPSTNRTSPYHIRSSTITPSIFLSIHSFVCIVRSSGTC